MGSSPWKKTEGKTKEGDQQRPPAQAAVATLQAVAPLATPVQAASSIVAAIHTQGSAQVPHAANTAPVVMNAESVQQPDQTKQGESTSPAASSQGSASALGQAEPSWRRPKSAVGGAAAEVENWQGESKRNEPKVFLLFDKQGQQAGPFSIRQIQQRFSSDQSILSGILVQRTGYPQKIPLKDFLELCRPKKGVKNPFGAAAPKSHRRRGASLFAKLLWMGVVGAPLIYLALRLSLRTK